MTNCKNYAVQQGYKPAEAVLQIAEPLRLKNLEECRVMNLETIARLDRLNDQQAARITELKAELAARKAAPAGVAEPAPMTFMTEDQACEFAWGKVREDVGTSGWTTGDSSNFYGFYMWGWRYRAQYEMQRTATRSAVMQELTAAPAAQAVEPAGFDLDTAEGARGFVSWYFANVLQQHDHEQYITAQLPGAFACDIAKALRATPQAQAGEAIAEITSASHDAAEFGDRGLRLLTDFQHLEYGTKLYALAAPQAQDVQDAARLDYLIKSRAEICHDETCADGYWLQFSKKDRSRWVQVGEFETAREAIDAAIAASAAKGS